GAERSARGCTAMDDAARGGEACGAQAQSAVSRSAAHKAAGIAGTEKRIWHLSRHKLGAIRAEGNRRS
ncbi:MAG: hypothetical protein RDU24_15130, partial [Humidesulfovibrio sp.]|uniref:hypothetical protein n=1 Tax=Humidesulfovibrio sp. TaxID=2910988 RepID=UPI0027E7EECD